MPPVTIWTPNNSRDEYSNGGVFVLADTTGTLIVDTAANDIADTGVIVTPLAQTIWVEDDSK